MKRLILALAVLASVAAPALAAGPFGTKENYMLRRMFTYGGNFGFPAYAADPFTCSATTIRTTYYNTVSNIPKFCNGTTWLSMSGSAPTSPISGDLVATGKWTFGSAADAASSVRFGDVAGCVVFEGATANAFESSLCATDPTVGDQVFNLPDLAGATTDTFVTRGVSQALTGLITFGSAQDAAGSVRLGETGSCIVFEGATANAFETSLCVVDPTVGDAIFNLPNIASAGTVTIPCTSCTQTWNGINTFSATQNFGGTNSFTASAQVSIDQSVCFGAGCAASSNTFPAMYLLSALTPDSWYFGTSSTSNSFHIAERLDAGVFDFQNCSAGTSFATNPLLCIHSADGASTTKWIDLKHTGTHGSIAVGLGGLILPGMIATAGTAPAVSNTTANSCGTTAASLAGTDTTGVITVGATSGTSCTITFVVAAPTRRQCWCNNEITGNLCRYIPLTTSTGKLDGVFVAGDAVSYGCLTY